MGYLVIVGQGLGSWELLVVCWRRGVTCLQLPAGHPSYLCREPVSTYPGSQIKYSGQSTWPGEAHVNLMCLGENVSASLKVKMIALMVPCVQFSSIQSLSHVQLFATPWTAECQTSLSITNSWSLLRLMSIVSVMPSNHLILYCPHLLSPSIFPSIKVFPNESVLHIKWPKYWSFSFSISPSNKYSGLISFRMD